MTSRYVTLRRVTALYFTSVSRASRRCVIVASHHFTSLQITSLHFTSLHSTLHSTSPHSTSASLQLHFTSLQLQLHFTSLDRIGRDRAQVGRRHQRRRSWVGTARKQSALAGSVALLQKPCESHTGCRVQAEVASEQRSPTGILRGARPTSPARPRSSADETSDCCGFQHALRPIGFVAEEIHTRPDLLRFVAGGFIHAQGDNHTYPREIHTHPREIRTHPRVYGAPRAHDAHTCTHAPSIPSPKQVKQSYGLLSVQQAT